MRDTSNMTAPLGLFTWLSRWNERRRRRKAIEMRLATLLTLVLKFPVATALVYGQEVHYNYERGANFAAYQNLSMGRHPYSTHPNPIQQAHSRPTRVFHQTFLLCQTFPPLRPSPSAAPDTFRAAHRTSGTIRRRIS